MLRVLAPGLLMVIDPGCDHRTVLEPVVEIGTKGAGANRRL